MAVLTDIGGGDVRRVLAGGVNAIVAAEAIARNVRVVKDSRNPHCACVAIVTLFA